MAYFHRKFYYHEKEVPASYMALEQGYHILSVHPLFAQLLGDIFPKNSHLNGKGSFACVTRNGNIFVNMTTRLSPGKWSYVLAHCLLHLAFGHFDESKLPQHSEYLPEVWNKACDIYITRFLADIGFGSPVVSNPALDYSVRLNDEVKIYEHLIQTEGCSVVQNYGMNTPAACDMFGLNQPLRYKATEHNSYIERFSYAITHSVKSAVSDAGKHDWDEKKETPVSEAAAWFLSHYPLLGGLASSFKIIEDIDFCYRNEIRIAAVDASHGEIYANPSCGLSEEEWKFVLAHEYLHAGLCHHKRCMGRDPYLWNVACDYVINDWLHEMQIGEMPDEGVLYDESLHNLSAESIYDRIVKEIRRFRKCATFRGYKRGDIWSDLNPHFEGLHKGLSLDEFFKNSLKEGLDYHIIQKRGFIPAGLVEEIQALAMPPIPWTVELANWFDLQFPALEKHRTYARPSRRQGATPDIPRPNYLFREQDLESRTFGVIIDTSGSMSTRQIGLALGAVASYAVSRDVPFVRIVFCDADASDAGYMAPQDIAGRVEVTGRGGTVLQPGVDLLETAHDFPKQGTILVITDAYIEPDLKIKREHAFLIPKGHRLPFSPKGKVFYFQEE